MSARKRTQELEEGDGEIGTDEVTVGERDGRRKAGEHTRPVREANMWGGGAPDNYNKHQS